MSSLPPSDDQERELDRLLGQARWPDPSDAQLARLSGRWRSLRRRRQPRTYRLVIAATIAACLIVTTLIVGRGARGPGPGVAPRHEGSPAVALQQPATPQPTQHETEAATNGAATIGEIAEQAIDRSEISGVDRRAVAAAPTLYEQALLADRMMIRSSSVPRRNPSKRRVPKTATRHVATIATRPHLRRGGGPTRPKSITLVEMLRHVAAIARDPDQYEPLLWAAVREQRGFARASAAELLSRIGTHRSLGAFAELLEAPETHAAGVQGLARLATPPEVAYLASREPDAALRRMLLASLASRGTEQSVGLYLGFVARPATRREALDALIEMPRPPTDVLFGYLRSMVGRERLAAAQALGRVNDPAVAQALWQSLEEPGSRQDAIIALLLSRTPQAAVAVDAARIDPMLLASVRAAEFEINHLDISRER